MAALQAGRPPAASAPAPREQHVAVRRESDVPQVVAASRRFCRELGLSPLLAAHVATAASELANNLWMHAAQGGAIVLRVVRDPARHGVELLARDEGPGIADLDAALREGFSTGGGLGCGLPGVRRLMDEFHIQSRPGEGTQVRCIKWAPAAPPRRP